MSISRREFLKNQLLTGLCLTTGLRLLSPGPVQAALDPDLAVVKGGNAPACRAAVELLGGMTRYVRPGQKVVIKPNMSFDSPPEQASNTHPEVVRCLALMCREAGATRISVLDNPLRQAELCLEASGMKRVEQDLEQCRVRYLDTGRHFKEVDLPSGEQLRRTEVMREVLEADVLIAAPVAKHHASGGVSLSMKGMMGLILNRGVFHYRYDLHTAIVDLCTLLKPQLTVIDASRALTTNGPSGPGKVVHLQTIVASEDMVAADAYVTNMVKWYGQSISPDKVKHIRLGHARGLGRMDIENLNIERLEL
ncbi:MAG: DUF362 domain-containing protein [Thermodesulfobacteriota bacterium]